MLTINNKNVLQWSDVLMQLQQKSAEQLAKPAATFDPEIGDFVGIESLTNADDAGLVSPAPKNQLIFVPDSDAVIE